MMTKLNKTHGLLFFAWLSLAPSTLEAHVGGNTLRLDFVSPQGLILVENDQLTLKWSDGDDDEVARHHFFYQQTNSTPEPVPALSELEGTEFFSIGVPDTDNVFFWDLSDVPQGAYFVYSETQDPPNCHSIRFAESIVVVDRQEELPEIRALWFEEPGAQGLVFAEGGRVIIRAISQTRPLLTVAAGYTAVDYENEAEDSPCLFQRSRWIQETELVELQEMVADPEMGPSYWKFEFEWDTRETPNGAYLLRATFEVEDDKSVIYAPGWISVYRPGNWAPGPTDEEAAGCAHSTTERSSTQAFVILLALLASLRFRIRALR